MGAALDPIGALESCAAGELGAVVGVGGRDGNRVGEEQMPADENLLALGDAKACSDVSCWLDALNSEDVLVGLLAFAFGLGLVRPACGGTSVAEIAR